VKTPCSHRPIAAIWLSACGRGCELRRGFFKALVSICLILCPELLGLFSTGCAGIGQSVQLGSTVLVKMPIEDPISGGGGGGWQFRHVLEAPKDIERRGEWYVAWNDRQPMNSGVFRPYWNGLFSRAPEIADAAHDAFGVYPVLIEPNSTFVGIVAKQPPEPRPGEIVHSAYGAGVRLVRNKGPTPVWPDGRKADLQHPGEFVIDPTWYLDDEHSELAAARRRFKRPGEGISIGHLDNGLDGRHSAAPFNLVRGDIQANAVGLLEYAEAKTRQAHPMPPPPPELTGATHGLGTIGILAGSWVSLDETKIRGGRIKGYDGWLGGAPFARIIPVRVAPWVFSVNTAELAYAIDYASRVKGADIITMSHGGAPTQAWVDAVNAAYERGTAMFAAESDFFSIMPEPFRPNGIILPASPVYPAGFRRVLGVTGVTADHRSYARNSLLRLLRSPFALFQWMARGSYGADGTSTVFYRPNRKPDPSETWRQGQLRPYPIAAYSPNVPWLSVRQVNGVRIADGVDLDGGGTSAATPQVAAAAALWLQKHRVEFSGNEWRHWQKAEATYYALLKSADRRGKAAPDVYLGAGLLRANEALNLAYSDFKRAKRPPGHMDPDNVPEGSLWFEPAPNDYFDGARSLYGLLGLHTLRYVDPTKRALLKQTARTGETRLAALQRLYYNMMLLREWHGGDIPTKGRDEDLYWRRAEVKAQHAQQKIRP
jgi:subtilisin family serine protease